MLKKSVIFILIALTAICSFAATGIQNGKAKSVLFIVTEQGFDDKQFMIAYSRLRAAGYAVAVASPDGGKAQSLRNRAIQTDLTIDAADEKDYLSLCIIGNNSISALYGNTALEQLCRNFNSAGKILAAQEFSTLIFSRAALLKGKQASTWPSEAAQLQADGAVYSKALITEAGNIITGMGGSDENFNLFTRKYIAKLNGKPSVLPNKDIALQFDETQQWFVMTHNNKTRTGLIHVPPAYNRKKAFSLVFGLHGTNGCGEDFQRMGFDRLADDLEFIMVYPDGYNGDWEIIPGWSGGVDDAGYFTALITALKKQFHIDPARIYVTGHSLGGFMSYRLAYDLSNEFTAAAPASGLMYLPQKVRALRKPVSILHLHAIDDRNVLFEPDNLYENPAAVMPGLVFWKKLNAISGEGTEFFNHAGIKGTLWSNAKTKTDVAVLIAASGGHSWQPFATEQIAEFFYNHPARSNSLKINYQSLLPYNESGDTITIDTLAGEAAKIKRVTFFANDRKIGEDDSAPFSFTWQDAQPGQYRLTANAETTKGEVIHSTSNETIWVTDKDYAKNTLATASSLENPALIAHNAIDGDNLSRWASASADPQWLAIDLQKLISVCGVTLIWEAAYATAYDIQVSVDNKLWTTVYSTTKASGGTDYINFDAITARYVRMHGKKRATQWGYSLYDFMVHGTNME